MKSYRLEFIVFITGACVMILELVGSRVLSPYVGNSLFVWTSLIGIILGSLSLGYWYGGQLADRNPSEKIFAGIILAAAACIGVIALGKPLVLQSIVRHIHDVRVEALLATTVLFAPASILLGMISPYAVKLKMRALSSSGATVGSLYAVSTIGSIVGTFLAGFWLVAAFGNTMILWMLSGALAATAILAHAGSWPKMKIAVLILAIAAASGAKTLRASAMKNGLVDVDTPYQRVLIFERTDNATGRPIRAMVTGPRIMQSAVFADGDPALVFAYNKYYRLADHFFGQGRSASGGSLTAQTALTLGGAGYTQPRDWLRRHPEGKIDVVEIDPMMTALAMEYFGLTPDQRLHTYHEDARTFLNRAGGRYDVIFADAFQALYGIPYQLTTVEAVRAMANRLTDDGVVMANIISGISPDKSAFLRAELATYRAVFPQVYFFPVQGTDQPDRLQNIMLVAMKSTDSPAFTSPDPELNGYLGARFMGNLPNDLPILTDDHAPVDQYLLPLGL